MTIDEIRERGVITEGQGGEEMVSVTVLADGFRDNGKLYAAGHTAHMEISVCAKAVEAGQVELMPAAGEPRE